MRCLSSGSAASRIIQSAKTSGSAQSATKPFNSCWTTSGIAPADVVRIGIPYSIASNMEFGTPSSDEVGCNKMCDDANSSALRKPRTVPASVTFAMSPRSTIDFRRVNSGPGPAITRSRFRSGLRRWAIRNASRATAAPFARVRRARNRIRTRSIGCNRVVMEKVFSRDTSNQRRWTLPRSGYSGCILARAASA